MPENDIKIPKRILSALLSSLSAGVVPRTGAAYIVIGRDNEIVSLCRDLETVSDGGAFTRFVIGRYGSGKSFLLQLLRSYACEKGFLCADADLSPERRLSASGGAGLATYRELIKNLSSKTSGDGGALSQVIVRWISSVKTDVAADGVSVDSEAFSAEVSKRIFAVMRELESGIGSFDLARVISTFYKAYESGDGELESACVRWLRGEYKTRTEARQALGVTAIIDDSNWYDYIKLLASFSRKIGYKGLIILIDECVNLYKIPNRISRENNYEKILSIYNDTMQGKAEGLGVIFAGTPQFLEDGRRGLFSYEALRSRLSDTAFAMSENFVPSNLSGPVIRLAQLSEDELLALIKRVTVLYGMYYGETGVSDEEMRAFLYKVLSGNVAKDLVTPREIIRTYLSVLGAISGTNGKIGDLIDTAHISAPERNPDELDPNSIEI